MFAWFEGVLEANRRFNLTRIVDPADAAVKHFADSIAPLGWADQLRIRLSRVLDVGTGAGFPAAPLAIMRPDWQVTAIDSTAKKVRFVAELAAGISLPNLRAEHRRAGEWTPPERFDLVTARAVGKLAECVEGCRDLVRPGGHLAVYKTATMGAPERRTGAETARRRRFAVLKPFGYDLRSQTATLRRALWVFRRT